MGMDVALNVWPSCRTAVVAWGNALMTVPSLTTNDVLKFIAALHGLMPSWHCSVRRTNVCQFVHVYCFVDTLMAVLHSPIILCRSSGKEASGNMP
jgi:hypothetical protein